MKFNSVIFRIFEARAKPGKVDLLRQKLSATSVSVVEGTPGNLGYFFGENLSSNQDDLVFISIWQDLESVKTRFDGRTAALIGVTRVGDQSAIDIADKVKAYIDSMTKAPR